MIGTPFMSKDIKEQRKIAKMNKKPWQHEVRDDKGRRRFHGAFTGGFSAGYYNTVGSKEGWKPKERYENGLKQNVVDFMDEEDIKDIYKEGCCYGKVNNDENKVDMNKENDIFDYLLKDNTNNDRRFNALQKELMINAGFDVECKENGNCLFLSKDNEEYYKKIDFKCKEDYYGIGYEGKSNVNSSNTHMNNIKNDNIIHMNISHNSNNIYDNDMNEYNYEETSLLDNINSQYAKKEKPITFIKSKQPLHIQLDIKMPNVPDDYVPFQQNYNVGCNVNVNVNPRVVNTISKRNEKLFTSNINDRFTSQEVINIINNIKQTYNFNVDIPFSNNSSKLKEFQQFLQHKRNATAYNANEEFEELYKLNEEQLINNKINYIKHQTQLNLTQPKPIEVSVTSWQPSSLLCDKLHINTLQYNKIQQQIIKETQHLTKTNHQDVYNTIQIENNNLNIQHMISHNTNNNINIFEELFTM